MVTKILRQRKRSAVTGSGGVTVFVKDWVIQTFGVQRISRNFNECVIFLFKADIFQRSEDLILNFTYITPENLPIYTDEDTGENTGLVVLNENILEIISHYPTAELF